MAIVRQIACLAVLFCLSTLARGDRIYQLVDYPDLQNGYTLSGTITTTDDAPEDGLLEGEEVVDWEWSISGPNNLSASYSPSTEGSYSFTKLNGVLIDDNAIMISSLQYSDLLLEESSEGWNAPQFRVRWTSSQHDNVLKTSAGVGEGGYTTLLCWSNEISLAVDDVYVVAIIVPEPTSATCVVMCLAWLPIFRKHAHDM